MSKKNTSEDPNVEISTTFASNAPVIAFAALVIGVIASLIGETETIGFALILSGAILFGSILISNRLGDIYHLLSTQK